MSAQKLSTSEMSSSASASAMKPLQKNSKDLPANAAHQQTHHLNTSVVDFLNADWRVECFGVEDQLAYLFWNKDSVKKCDVVFKVGPGKTPIYAHKLLCILGSPVMEALLKNHPDGPDGVVEILEPNLDPEAFTVMLSNFYSPKLMEKNLPYWKAPDVMECAKKYSVNSLYNACFNFLQRNLDVEHMISVYEKMEDIDSNLSQLLLGEICNFGRGLFATNDWLFAKLSTVKAVVGSSMFRGSEEDIVAGLDRWVEDQLQDVLDHNEARTVRIYGKILQGTHLEVRVQKLSKEAFEKSALMKWLPLEERLAIQVMHLRVGGKRRSFDLGKIQSLGYAVGERTPQLFYYRDMQLTTRYYDAVEPITDEMDFVIRGDQAPFQAQVFNMAWKDRAYLASLENHGFPLFYSGRDVWKAKVAEIETGKPFVTSQGTMNLAKGLLPSVKSKLMFGAGVLALSIEEGCEKIDGTTNQEVWLHIGMSPRAYLERGAVPFGVITGKFEFLVNFLQPLSRHGNYTALGTMQRSLFGSSSSSDRIPEP